MRGGHGAEPKDWLTSSLSPLAGCGTLGFLVSCEPSTLILLAIVEDIDVAYRVEVLHYLRLLLRVLSVGRSEVSV
jgi:hypothetical protein